MSTVSLAKIDPLDLAEFQDRDKLRIGAAVQQLFWINGEIPSIETVHEFLQGMYKVEAIEEYFSMDEFQSKLRQLGLKTDTPVSGALTPEQILVANMEMSVLDRRSIRQKLEQLNDLLKAQADATETPYSPITLNQYEAWRRDPAYKSYIAVRAKQLYGDLEAQAHKNLAKAMEGGDLNATKLYLELTGKYQKNVNLNVNVEAVMVRIVEIVARHIHDPQVLEAIATDMEALEL